VPLALAGLQIDGDETFGEQVVSGPRAAVVVMRRQLHGQVRHPELEVDGDLRPHAGVAGIGPRVLFPRLGANLPRFGNGLEHPQPLARSHVERAHATLHVRSAARVGAGLEGGADEDDIAGDDGRGVQADRRRIHVHGRVEVQFEIDDAVAAERGVTHPGLRIERDQAIAGRHVEDAFLAAVAPVREAAARQLSRRRRRTRAFVLAVHPLQLARCRIEREHRAACAAGRIKTTADHQRR
jgi:hypothetical protein